MLGGFPASFLVLYITFVWFVILFTQCGSIWNNKEDSNFPAMIRNKKNLISEAQELYKHWHIDNPTWILIWWRITKGQVLTRIDGQQKETDKNPRDKIHQGYFWGQGVKRIHTVCQIQFNFVSSGNSRKNGTAPHKNWQLKIWLNYNKTQN